MNILGPAKFYVSSLVVSLLLVLGSPLAFGADEPARIEDSLTEENMAKLEKGKTVFEPRSLRVDGKSRGGGLVMVVVEKPRPEVWQYLISTKDDPEYMPRLLETSEYYRKGKEVGLRQVVKGVFKKIVYHVIQTRDVETYTVTWRLDDTKENGIVDTTGSWKIFEHGEGKCILAYTMSVDTGMSIPRPLEKLALRYDLPDVVQALKKRAESDGKYKK